MIIYYLKEALNSFKRTKIFSFFSVLSLSLSICFLMCVALLYLASSKIEDKLKNKIEVLVFLDNDVTSEQKIKVKSVIEKSDIVSSTDFVPKEKSLSEFIQKSGQDIKSTLEFNPLPDYYKVSFNKYIDENNLEELKLSLTNVNGISDIVLDYDFVIGLLNALNSGRMIIFVISILLTIISIYLIFSGSKFYILHNTQKFNTMKFVGAKLSTLKTPLLLRGLIIGFFASVLSMLIISVILITLQSLSHQFKFVPSLYFINFVILLLGLLLGPIGTGIFNKRVSLKITSN